MLSVSAASFKATDDAQKGITAYQNDLEILANKIKRGPAYVDMEVFREAIEDAQRALDRAYGAIKSTEGMSVGN